MNVSGIGHWCFYKISKFSYRFASRVRDELYKKSWFTFRELMSKVMWTLWELKSWFSKKSDRIARTFTVYL